MDPEPGVDFDRPNAARMYDYMLGGGANFAVDRDLVQQLLVVNPDARRVFVAFAHAREMLVGLDTVTVTRADLRDADGVLTAPGVAGLLDFSRPVALLAVAVLHFVPGDITTVLESYRAALAPGSALAISHGSDDQDDPELASVPAPAAPNTATAPPQPRTAAAASCARCSQGSTSSRPGWSTSSTGPNTTPIPSASTALWGSFRAPAASHTTWMRGVSVTA